jgi:hypothetical protein
MHLHILRAIAPPDQGISRKKTKTAAESRRGGDRAQAGGRAHVSLDEAAPAAARLEHGKAAERDS